MVIGRRSLTGQLTAHPEVGFGAGLPVGHGVASGRARSCVTRSSKAIRVGNIAYGYRLPLERNSLEPEPHEQAVLAQVRALRASRRSLRGIAAELNARGLRTRRNSSCASSTSRASSPRNRCSIVGDPSRLPSPYPTFCAWDHLGGFSGILAWVVVTLFKSRQKAMLRSGSLGPFHPF